MKSLIFCVVLMGSSFLTSLPDMSGITNALKSGDATKLATFFDANVDLAILDDEDVYKKEEAKQKVATFFSSHKPSSFQQVHKGTSKGANSHYVIGEMTASGKTYRVYILLEETADSYRIQELRIEE